RPASPGPRLRAESGGASRGRKRGGAWNSPEWRWDVMIPPGATARERRADDVTAREVRARGPRALRGRHSGRAKVRPPTCALISQAANCDVLTPGRMVASPYRHGQLARPPQAATYAH